jgi:hypothetical protein
VAPMALVLDRVLPPSKVICPPSEVGKERSCSMVGCCRWLHQIVGQAAEGLGFVGLQVGQKVWLASDGEAHGWGVDPHVGGFFY